MRGVVVARVIQQSSLYALLFLLPFSKAAIEIAFPLLLIGWVAERIKRGWGTSIWRRTRIRWCLVALLVYVGICALSILTSSHPELSARGFLRKTLEYVLLFLIGAELGKESEVARWCVLLVMVSASIVGLDAVAQELTGTEPLRGHQLFIYGRMTGPYENPIDLATYVLVVLPIALTYLMASRMRNKMAVGILTLLLIGCLIRTESQGAWLGFLSGLVVLGVSARRVKTLALASSLGLLAVGGLLFYARSQSPGVLDFSDVGTQDRLFIWQAGWNMVQDRPLLGHGLNTFMANYLMYWVGGEQQPRYAHNCFLQVAAETGFMGLAAFMWLLGTMCVIWWRALRRMPESRARSLLLGLVAGLTGFLVQSFFDTNFYALRQAVLFWTLAGLATGCAMVALQGDVKPSRSA